MGRWMRDAALAILLGAGVAVLLTAMVMPVCVKGISMEPTISSGSWVLVDKVAYSSSMPCRGDLVIIENVVFTQEGEGARLLKRIVGLPGDRVQISGERLFVNGEDKTEELCAQEHIFGDMETVIVEEGCIFVMGDNADQSMDSRSEAIGQLPIENIWGKAFFQVYPWKRFGPLGRSPA